MKKTTKIMIAMLANGMVVLFATIAYIAFCQGDGDPLSCEIEIFGESKASELNQFEKIILTDDTDAYISSINGVCRVVVDTTLSRPEIRCSEDWNKYLTVNVSNGVLNVCTDFDQEDVSMVNASEAPVEIALPTSVKSITNESKFALKINNLKSENFHLSSKDNTPELIDCEVNHLEVNNAWGLDLINTRIETLKCDLSQCTGRWKCDNNSVISTIKATGSPGYGDFASLLEVNYREFIWEPSDSDSFTKIGVNSAVKVIPIKN